MKPLITESLETNYKNHLYIRRECDLLPKKSQKNQKNAQFLHINHAKYENFHITCNIGMTVDHNKQLHI